MIQFNRRAYRFFEMIPGLMAWMVIFFPLWGSFFVPKLVAYFTITFLVYWIYQSFKMAILGTRGYFLIQKSLKTNWRQKYKRDRESDWLSWTNIRHIIIIPNYNETVEKLSTSLDALVNQKDISKDQLIVVLAMEERATGSHERAAALLKKYQGKFGFLTATFHPADIEGEVKGKASNEAWAAKEIKKQLINERGEKITNFTISSCDADARFHSQYFSALTYFFSRNKKRYLRFWQSPILWYNNINRVPGPIRVVGIVAGIGHIANIQEPHGIFINYSTYSLSLKLLDDTGYWDTDIIPEDWHLFLQTFFRKKGRVAVRPIFLPTSIDAPEGKTYFEALKNRYLQCQRHAWGATDIPYAMAQSIKHPEIPFLTKALILLEIVKSHLLWSTNWFILTLGASLPAFLNPKFFQTALGYNLPRFSQTILTLCLVALFIMVAIDMRLRPKEVKARGFKGLMFELAQWLIMPVVALFMAVLPGLDAQTKLLLGKRLEYKVTKKY